MKALGCSRSQMGCDFPITLFSENIRDGISARFIGSAPTLDEIARVPDSYWLSLPGVGHTKLAKLRQVIRALSPVKEGLHEGASSARDLASERKRLESEIDTLRRELNSRQLELKTVVMELKLQGVRKTVRKV